MLVEFSLKLAYIPLGVGKVFSFMVFTFLKNALNLAIFTHVTPHKNLPLNSCHHNLGRRKLLIAQGSIFSEICFSQQQKEVEETMICLINFNQKI